MATWHRPRDGLVEAGGVGADFLRKVRVERDTLRHHLRQRTSGIVEEMPFLGHDFAQHLLQPLWIVDDLFEQGAKLPLVKDPADVEYDCLD